MKPNVVFGIVFGIVLIVVLYVVLFEVFFRLNNEEKFEKQNKICPEQKAAHRMCKDIANSYGTLPSYANNECWLQTYRTCLNHNNECKCSQIADEKCYVSSSPPNTIYQKCMATQGFARDPDRG